MFSSPFPPISWWIFLLCIWCLQYQYTSACLHQTLTHATIGCQSISQTNCFLVQIVTITTSSFGSSSSDMLSSYSSILDVDSSRSGCAVSARIEHETVTTLKPWSYDLFMWKTSVSTDKSVYPGNIPHFKFRRRLMNLSEGTKAHRHECTEVLTKMSHQLLCLFRIFIASLYNALCTKQSRLFTLVVLICLLSEPVFVSCGASTFRDDIEIKRHTKIPSRHAVGATSKEPVYLEYPWNPRHDERPGRENHQDWRKGMKRAYCVHTSPDYYKPFQHPNVTIGPICSSWAHQDQHGRTMDQVPCYSEIDDITQIVDPDGIRKSPRLKSYVFMASWNNVEQVQYLWGIRALLTH